MVGCSLVMSHRGRQSAAAQWSAALALYVLAAAPPAPAHEPDPPAAFGASTARVAVDLVVRGKEGELLRGLTATDVELFEDGVRQEVESLELVEHAPQEAEKRAGEAPPLLAIVFDGLSPESRRAAHDAVLLQLRNPLRNPPLLGIFSIERGLRMLQAFTDNPETQRRALERLIAGGSVSYSGARERDDIRHAHAGLGEGSPQTHVVPAQAVSYTHLTLPTILRV